MRRVITITITPTFGFRNSPLVWWRSLVESMGLHGLAFTILEVTDAKESEESE